MDTNSSTAPTSTAQIVVCPNCNKSAYDEESECSWCKFDLTGTETPRLSDADEALRKSARDAHFELVERNPYKMLKAYAYLEIAQAVKAHVLSKLPVVDQETVAAHIEENYVFLDGKGNARLNKLGCSLFLTQRESAK